MKWGRGNFPIFCKPIFQSSKFNLLYVIWKKMFILRKIGGAPIPVLHGGTSLTSRRKLKLMKINLSNTVCDYRGRKYDVGQEFSAGDDCNKCTCKYDGQVTCTEKKCLQCKLMVFFLYIILLTVIENKRSL